jgi:hypothetical protein
MIKIKKVDGIYNVDVNATWLAAIIIASALFIYQCWK